VYHAGAIGTDGQFLLDFMAAAGVHTEYVSVLEDVRTGNAIIQNDKEGDNCILLYGGANQAITKAQVDEVLSHFEQGDYLILQNEINNLSYIMEKAHERGIVIVLNPSPMNEKILKLPLEFVNIFMLNEVEAGQILGADSDTEKAALAEQLMKKYPEASVVLTLGGDGSVFVGNGSTCRQNIYRVPVADTTAAGDTFTGFFIGGILKGKSIEEAMDDASAAAAIACSRPGAAPSIPAAEELEAFKATLK
jgi:ribokinase